MKVISSRRILNWLFLSFLALFIAACGGDEESSVISTSTAPTAAVVVQKPRTTEPAGNSEAFHFSLSSKQLTEFYGRIDSGARLSDSEEFRAVKKAKDGGSVVILSIIWSAPEPLTGERIPQGEQRKPALNLVRRYFQDFGPQADFFSLQSSLNETGPYPITDIQPGAYGIPLLQWWQEMLQVVREEQYQNRKLERLKVVLPMPSYFLSLADDSNTLSPTAVNLFHQVLNFSNLYCDAIVLPLNESEWRQNQELRSYLEPLLQRPPVFLEDLERGLPARRAPSP